MSKRSAGLIVSLSLLLISVSAMGATRYVSDQLSINMRRGPSTSYAISELLQAGVRVQTLDEANGWTKIRTPKGEEGYVLTRFLSTEPAASDRVDQIETQLKKLKTENEDLHAELAQVMNGSEKLGQLKRELVAENEALKTKLDKIKRVSANAIEIKSKNQEYRKKLLVLQSQMEQLSSENKALQSRRDGMKIGALILIGGIILGLILPLFRRRKKSNWNSL